MKAMGRSTRTILFLFCAVLLSAVTLSAADAVIKGVVTDDTGKPVRGAVVKVSLGKITVNRYSQNDGSFAVTVPAGTYTVTVDAYSFGLARKQVDTSRGDTLSFKLSPGLELARMSGAELASMLPNDKDITAADYENVRECNRCHGFGFPMRHAGWKAKDWADFLPTMTKKRLGEFGGYGNGEQLTALSQSLEKVFGPTGIWGPDAQAPDPSKVLHADMKDGALKATVIEYTIPDAAMVHSAAVDQRSGIVWVDGYDNQSNMIGRFNPETAKFDEFKIPFDDARPHTGTVLRDGTFLTTLAGGKQHKMASVDKNGKLTIYDYEDKREATHTAKLDSTGNTAWITANDEIWAFDTASMKFRSSYKNPAPDTLLEGSQAAITARPNEKPSNGGYDVVSDSKGIVYFTSTSNGTVTRLDPKTGETKIYHTKEMRGIRGINVDAQDNIWWGDYWGHKLGHLDVKTGAIKEYTPPTAFASPYGIQIDMKRGYVWYGDTIGNQAVRFDPKTETFLEFPLPTRITSIRFSALDAEGRLWYSGYFTGKLGVIDPDGAIRPVMAQN